MRSHRRHVLRLLTATMGAGVFATRARAQAYPAKPVRLVVGYPPGGGVDAMARLLATRLSAGLGQQVVVDNRTGAAGLIAADHVATAAPDGYTLLLGETSVVIAPHIQARLAFDPLKSFTPIAGLFAMPLVIVVNNDFPATTLAQFVARLKAEPGRYSYATSGVGQVQHLGFELFKAQTGTSVVHVPYRGAAQIIPDMIGGQVPIGIISAAAGLAQVRGGRLRAMALMSAATLPGAEGIPALADLLPGFDATPRLFLAGPAGMPAAIVARLADTVRDVMAAPDLAGLAAAQGAVPAHLSAAALAADLPRESAKWGAIAREQKITIE